MFRTENALILREVRFKESDRILTALTADAGKMTLAAHGALSKHSRIAAATQQLTYAELTLFEKNGRYTVREGVTKEGFPGLRQDLGKLALGSYFAECLEQYAGEDQPEPELMQLGLNSLYALSEGLGSCEKIKAAFELRLMTLEGYAPAEESCPVCGRGDIREPVFLPEEGQTVCRACRKAGRSLPLTENALAAMRHILHAPAKKLLAFRLTEEEQSLLSAVAESWLLHCSDRNFPTLAYYRNLKL
ncbi:MAG: DNA repair protein RecO [Oscillospiraceae bacterium]|nr:DNA repair protein RecO [Oscillospiraceae bacterium]